MKIRSKLVAAMSAGLLAVGMTVLGAGVAHAADPHPIKNAGSGLCLEPQGKSLELFASIVQVGCDGTAAQRWFSQGFGGTNRWQFANEASHLCFDAFDGAFNGARLLQNQCAPISNDQFTSSRSLPDVVTLMSRVGFRDTNFCIDVPGNDHSVNVAMQLFQCNTTDAQKWLVGFGS
jgi:hypothetical protein